MSEVSSRAAVAAGEARHACGTSEGSEPLALMCGSLGVRAEVGSPASTALPSNGGSVNEPPSPAKAQSARGPPVWPSLPVDFQPAEHEEVERRRRQEAQLAPPVPISPLLPVAPRSACHEEVERGREQEAEPMAVRSQPTPVGSPLLPVPSRSAQHEEAERRREQEAAPVAVRSQPTPVGSPLLPVSSRSAQHEEAERRREQEAAPVAVRSQPTPVGSSLLPVSSRSAQHEEAERRREQEAGFVTPSHDDPEVQPSTRRTLSERLAATLAGTRVEIPEKVASKAFSSAPTHAVWFSAEDQVVNSPSEERRPPAAPGAALSMDSLHSLLSIKSSPLPDRGSVSMHLDSEENEPVSPIARAVNSDSPHALGESFELGVEDGRTSPSSAWVDKERTPLSPASQRAQRNLSSPSSRDRKPLSRSKTMVARPTFNGHESLKTRRISDRDGRRSLTRMTGLSFKCFIRKHGEERSVHDMYHFGQLLGEGATGSTWEAWPKPAQGMPESPKLKKQGKRAIKKLPKHCLSDQERETFLQEVQLLKDLDHPHICKLYEVFEDSQAVYLVMDLCEGGELFTRIIEEELKCEAEMAEIMRQITGALRYCHETHGIIHRDIKPENILFFSKKPNAPVKLIDFGIACHLKSDGDGIGRSGTEAYEAPEVLRGKDYNEKCDLWSLGALLYVMLSGYMPFMSAKHAAEGDFNFDAEDWDDVSDEAKDLISRLLVVDPAERLSAAEVLEHPWLCMQQDITASVQPHVLARLKNFKQVSAFRKILLLVLSRQLATNDLPDMYEAFKTFDRDGDGRLSRDELRDALLDRMPLEEGELEQILQAMDVDGSGCVDYSEFLAAAFDRKLIFREDLLLQVFRHLDRDSTGTVGITELHALLDDVEQMNGDMSHGVSTALREEARELLEQYDSDGDGVLDFDEFSRLLTQHSASDFGRSFNPTEFKNTRAGLQSWSAGQVERGRQRRFTPELRCIKQDWESERAARRMQTSPSVLTVQTEETDSDISRTSARHCSSPNVLTMRPTGKGSNSSIELLPPDAATPETERRPPSVGPQRSLRWASPRNLVEIMDNDSPDVTSGKVLSAPATLSSLLPKQTQMELRQQQQAAKSPRDWRRLSWLGGRLAGCLPCTQRQL